MNDGGKSKFLGSYYNEQAKLDKTVALIDISILDFRKQIASLSNTMEDKKLSCMQYIQEVGKEIPFDTSIEPQDKENKDNTKQVYTSMKKKQLKITDIFRNEKKAEKQVFFKVHNELAVKNVVSSKDSHIKNFGKSYYWYARKAIKPVGVDKDELSKEDRKIYDSVCNFSCPSISTFNF